MYGYIITQMRSMVLVYLTTKLGDFVRANVDVHIPGPWFAYGLPSGKLT